MYSAFHCSDYYGNSVAMSVATDLGNPQFKCVTERVSLSDRIFVRFRLLRMADSRYSYQNNTGILILLSPGVSIVVSPVSRVTLLGLSFRQYSFYLYRYIHLTVQSQPDN